MANADGSGGLTRLTYNHSFDYYISWWVPDTPVGKAVSVVRGDATLTFAQVTAEGSTQMYVTGDLPGPLPPGWSLIGELWKGATNAQVRGSVSVALHYGPSLVARGSTLALLQWDSAKGKWQDITVLPVDRKSGVVRGAARDLSTFAVVAKAR